MLPYLLIQLASGAAGATRPQVFLLLASVSNVWGLPASDSRAWTVSAARGTWTLSASPSTPVTLSAGTSNTWAIKGQE